MQARIVLQFKWLPTPSALPKLSPGRVGGNHGSYRTVEIARRADLRCDDLDHLLSLYIVPRSGPAGQDDRLCFGGDAQTGRRRNALRPRSQPAALPVSGDHRRLDRCSPHSQDLDGRAPKRGRRRNGRIGLEHTAGANAALLRLSARRGADLRMAHPPAGSDARVFANLFISRPISAHRSRSSSPPVSCRCRSAPTG